MTYNIKGHATVRRGDHLAQVAEVIQAAAPDVVCLQEVLCRTRREPIDQAEELSRLTGLRVAFGRSCEMDGGDYGNAVLTRGEVTGHSVHALPGSGEARSLMRSDVVVDGLAFSVFVTHLSAWGRLRRRDRLAQVKAIGDLTATTVLPHVLAGDLNVSPRSVEIRALMEHGHLRPTDAMTEPTFPLTRQRLDYIFCDRGWRVIASAVLRHGPSDHWPVIAELAPGAG